MEWKKELQHMLTVGCTDSAIKDYIEEHPEINGKDIWDYVWDYVYESNAPSVCRGCKYIQMRGMFPCTECSRQKQIKDYYEQR